MTLFERAKSFGVCFKRVHERHLSLYEARKDMSGMHPTFFENDMALALAMERIKELEDTLRSCAGYNVSSTEKMALCRYALATSKAVGLE